MVLNIIVLKNHEPSNNSLVLSWFYSKQTNKHKKDNQKHSVGSGKAINHLTSLYTSACIKVAGLSQNEHSSN